MRTVLLLNPVSLHTIELWTVFLENNLNITKRFDNTGSGNGLLPDGTKPLPEPLLTIVWHYSHGFSPDFDLMWLPLMMPVQGHQDTCHFLKQPTDVTAVHCIWRATRRSENDNTPQPLDQWTNSPFMGQQVGNCKSFTLAHSLANLFAMHCDPRESPSCIRHYIQLASLLFQVDQPSHS